MKEDGLPDAMNFNQLLGLIRRKFFTIADASERSVAITHRTMFLLVAKRWLEEMNVALASITDKNLQSQTVSHSLSAKKTAIRLLENACEYPVDPFKNINLLYGLVEPDQKPPPEATIFREKLERIRKEIQKELVLPFDRIKNVTDATQFRPIFAEAESVLTGKMDKLLGTIVREEKSIQNSARATSAEVQAQISQTRITAAASVLTTIIAAFLLWWFGTHKTDESNRESGLQDLRSEYKVRLGEAENLIPYLNTLNTNSEASNPAQISLLRLIDGSYSAQSNETRVTISWDRLIRDLQVKYQVEDDADNAASSIFAVKSVLLKSRPIDVKAIDKYFFNLKSFGTNVDDEELTWWEKNSPFLKDDANTFNSITNR